MSYYGKSYSDDTDLGTSLIMILICIGFLILVMIGTNSCSATTWNDGVCPECETRYELRAVNNGLKYYSCPDCGQEVKRY